MIGAGVLGTTIAYWISELYDCSVALIDKEDGVAKHMSTRNTGVDHRPFYLDPEKKKRFAKAAQISHPMWATLAKKYELPWNQVGTLEIAKDESDVSVVEKYGRWALQNGMEEGEAEVLNSQQVNSLEPEVKCAGAIYSKTDTATDFGVLSESVCKLAVENGVSFLSSSKVITVEEDEDHAKMVIERNGEYEIIKTKFLINASGGSSVELSHRLGLGKKYSVLYFRGEYRIVEPEFGQKIKRNIYSVPKHRDFPFLDPHFIVRASGKREVGPNAVLVSGPNVYKGLFNEESGFSKIFFSKPMIPKLKLFINGEFLSLVWSEWESSLSKKKMAERVMQFIPSLKVSYLNEKGLSGVRSSVIDSKGFVPEAVLIDGKNSLNIINFNSPGATGAPSWSAFVVALSESKGYLDGIAKREAQLHPDLWNFEKASAI